MVWIKATEVSYVHGHWGGRKFHRMVRRVGVTLLFVGLTFGLFAHSPRNVISKFASSYQPESEIGVDQSVRRALKRELVHVRPLPQGPGSMEAHRNDGEESDPDDDIPDQGQEGTDNLDENIHREHINEQPTQEPININEHIFTPLKTNQIAGKGTAFVQNSSRETKEMKEHLDIEALAEVLPEFGHIPLEDAIRDMKLSGWEDDWVAHAAYDPGKWGELPEPKIDFVYLWVNGSDKAFERTKRPYELRSVLNDPEGTWLQSHGTNRYRDWDELRYSVRSVEKYAGTFRNNIQLVVNSVDSGGKQSPTWLRDDAETRQIVQVLAQEDFFDREKHGCLPTFNSLTIENQLFNTPSDTDQIYALSDDMLLGKPHAASDIYSPLFGPVMGFKTNSYSMTSPPSDVDARRFGEKPFLIYTSWLLNKRFGIRKRKGQGHFGHSLSRDIMREAITSFPGPELLSACKRFRGEPGFQLYSWYATFHYLIERHREALLWSYIMLRSDRNDDGYLGSDERRRIQLDIASGMRNEGKLTYRKRHYFHVAQMLQKAGLEAPRVNTDIVWTSLDGPQAIRDVECSEFDVNECLAPGFSVSSNSSARSPVFSTAVIFDRVSRQMTRCGDCLLKLILNQTPRGLEPLLPKQPKKRTLAIKAVMRYRYTIINPDALFVMVTDAEQVDHTLVGPYIRGGRQLAGQLCLNDDVATEDKSELSDVKQAMTELYQGLFPHKCRFEQ